MKKQRLDASFKYKTIHVDYDEYIESEEVVKLYKAGKINHNEAYEACIKLIQFSTKNLFILLSKCNRYDKLRVYDEEFYQETYIIFVDALNEYNPETSNTTFSRFLYSKMSRRFEQLLGISTVMNDVKLNSEAIAGDKPVMNHTNKDEGSDKTVFDIIQSKKYRPDKIVINRLFNIQRSRDLTIIMHRCLTNREYKIVNYIIYKQKKIKWVAWYMKLKPERVIRTYYRALRKLRREENISQIKKFVEDI